MSTPPPTEKDREHAALILDYIQNLRGLGAVSEQDTREHEIHFVALMLRNARLHLN